MSLPKTFGYGIHGEKFVIQIFEQAGINCVKNPDVNTRLEHDLDCQIGKTKFTCEVKFDVMAQRTGNIAIEYHNTRKDAPSGLNATKANLWAHILYDDSNKTLWLTSVSKLKEFCSKNIPKKVVKNAGDNNANLLIFPCDVILPSIFHRVENIDNKTITKIVKDLLKYEKLNTNNGYITINE